MRKIFLLFVLALLFQSPSLAASNITFVYINGSNSNDQKNQDWFIKGVGKLHPALKTQIEKNVRAESISPKINAYTINKEPKLLFWGFESKSDIEFMQSRLTLTKALSPTGAYIVRSLLSAYLHDAIWVQKARHVLPITDELNAIVQQEAEKGNKVVLFGYSAGTFVTYEYFFNKLRSINLEHLAQELKEDKDMIDFLKNNPRENTCISAISKGKIGVFDSSGNLQFNQNRVELKENYLNINKATQTYCAPENTVLGIINHASPLTLFYSDIADPDFEYSLFNKYLVKNIFENGLFFVTINFREDPLGFPMTKNLPNKEMAKIAGIELQGEPTGFLYDNSSVKSWRSFIKAHESYYNAKKIFSKAVTKTLSDGRRIQYDEAYRQKLIKQ